MRLLLTNIKGIAGVHNKATLRLSGKELNHLPVIEDAWMLIEDNRIHSFGPMNELPDMQTDQHIYLKGKWILPAWCDSHTHLVFAGSREQEFVDKINGLSYADIAARGGGILHSAARLAQADEQELFDTAYQRLMQVVAQGTGAIEIKSGYGLNTANELKMLRVIRRLKENTDVDVKATFLGAHAFPAEYKSDQEGYIKLITEEMIPRVTDEGLADYIDVFCEQGFFSVSQTERILEAGARRGLKAKIHANQLHHSGGVELGVKLNAVSVDHLECVGEKEIAALKGSNTIPTLLPGAAFFLGMHYQPARAIIDAGLSVCLATDYNPGSCPSGNVPLMMTIACTQMKMTPAECINATTVNGAAAMELEATLGSIVVGKKANLIITKPMNSYNYIPYDYGNNPVESMIINGKLT